MTILGLSIVCVTIWLVVLAICAFKGMKVEQELAHDKWKRTNDKTIFSSAISNFEERVKFVEQKSEANEKAIATLNLRHGFSK